MTQVRGATGGEKFRITFEARQGISDYFNPQKDPTGHILKSCLVLKGAHCSLDNIDDDHKFIKDKTFWIGDVKKEQVAGRSAGNLAYGLVELRKKKPELFKDLVVFQQPAAFMDEIIVTWIAEDSAQHFVQAIHQRDLFGAALTQTAKKASKLAQQISSWIAPKMTPVLQLTDTDIAYILKRAADEIKAQICRELRAAARENEERAFLDNLSLENIMKIVAAGHEALVQKNARLNLVLAGSRRNNMLSYRPDPVAKKMVVASSQSWAKDLPEGCHRQLPEWSIDRYNWLGQDGIPQREDWSKINQATDVADLAEADYCQKESKHMQDYSVVIGGKYVQIPVVEIAAAAQEIVPEADLEDMYCPKIRRMRAEAAKQGTSVADKAERKVWKERSRKKAKELLELAAQTDGPWKDWLHSSLLTATRKDLLQKLQPGVKGKPGSKKCSKIIKKNTKKQFGIKLAAIAAFKKKAASTKAKDAEVAEAATKATADAAATDPSTADAIDSAVTDPVVGIATDAVTHLKGKLGRVIDENLGRYAHGKIVAVIDAPSKDLMLCRVQGKEGLTAGQLVLTKSQIEWVDELKPPTEMKKMYFKMQDLLVLDQLFEADELEHYSNFKKDPRFASIHMSMGRWLINRDFQEDGTYSKCCIVDPDFTGAVLKEVTGGLADSADSLCLAVAKLRAMIDKKELVCIPVWGGLTDGELHWTLLTARCNCMLTGVCFCDIQQVVFLTVFTSNSGHLCDLFDSFYHKFISPL